MHFQNYVVSTDDTMTNVNTRLDRCQTVLAPKQQKAKMGKGGGGRVVI